MVFMRDADGKLSVLDGQQRLATTIIAFSALRDWYGPNQGNPNPYAQIQYDFFGRTEYGDTHPTPNLKLNLNNNDAFQAFLVQGRQVHLFKEKLKNTRRYDSNYNLLDAIVYSHSRIAELAEMHGERAKEYFSSLIRFMRDAVIVVRLTVPNESNAFKSPF